jgi:hypothetical protein
VIYRTVTFRELPGILVETMVTTAIVLFIIANVSALSWTLVVSQSASALADGIRAISDDPLIFLMLVNLLLLFLGSFIEDGAVLILMTPILVPIATSLGAFWGHYGAQPDDRCGAAAGWNEPVRHRARSWYIGRTNVPGRHALRMADAGHAADRDLLAAFRSLRTLAAVPVGGIAAFRLRCRSRERGRSHEKREEEPP